MPAMTPQGIRPHVPAAARVAAAPAKLGGPLATRMLPAVVVLGATYSVVSYVRSQLTTESSNFDRIFSQQNTPEHMARRGKALQVEQRGDPRNNLLNILGWNKSQ